MTALVTDIDGTLLGDANGLKELNQYLKCRRRDFYIVYATGRSIEEYMEVTARGVLIEPDAAIINTGADILRKNEIIRDWHDVIEDASWSSDKVARAMLKVEGIAAQAHLSRNKVCYFADPAAAPEIRDRVKKALKKAGVRAKVIMSHGKYIDILPERCDKGEAALFLMNLAKVKASDVIVAGDSENDLDLFMKFKRGIVVANALENLKNDLKGGDFYFAKNPYAAGILEGLRHYKT
jgi:sucrose-phosphate synthase